MLLTDFTQDDFAGLYPFMRPIWLETYGGFLPTEQIEFLLQKYFSEDGLKHFLALGYRYRKIADAGVLVTVDRGDTIYIDKLYLSPVQRGHGYAKAVFDELKKAGKDQAWLQKTLKAQKATLKETWLLTVDGSNQVVFYRKER